MFVIIDCTEPEELKIVMEEEERGFTKYFETEEEAASYADRMCIDYKVVEIDA